MASDLLLVKAGIPEMDDCRILTRLKAFLVDQGVCATLEHVFRDRVGNPADLSTWLASGVSESNSTSSSTQPAGTVKVRIKEWLGSDISSSRNPVWEIYGDTIDASAGILRVTLEEEIVERAGIYELNWAVLDENGKPVAIDRGILSVEKSMFAVDINNVYGNLGPPTIQEIRMRLMDSAANENLLLNDIEFKDEQILQAIALPIQFWNETPPPLRPLQTTRTFPFRGAWMSGILAQLHLTMANHFRRNVFRGAAGATSDKDKEREYMAEGQRLWAEYQAWVLNKKVEINLKSFNSANPSQYAGRSGW